MAAFKKQGDPQILESFLCETPKSTPNLGTPLLYPGVGCPYVDDFCPRKSTVV